MIVPKNRRLAFIYFFCQVQLGSTGSGSAGDTALEMELAGDERSEEDEEDGEGEPPSKVEKKNQEIRARNARAEALQNGAAPPASQTLGEKAG